MKNILIAFSAFVLLLTSLSCNDSSVLGADLFQGEKLNLTFTDTLSINAVTEKVDSVLLHTTAFSYDSLLLGKVNDPIFGLTESRIYTLLPSFTGTLPSIPSTATLDSAFFDLVYASSRINGDTLNQQTVGIYRVTETITDESIYSNRKLYTTEAAPVGTKTFKPNPYSSAISILRTDTTIYSPRVRVPLNPTFAKQFLDTSKLSTIATWFNGLEIRSEITTNTMLGFNFGGASSTKPNATAIRLYYKNDATDSTHVLVVPISSFHFCNFKHDIATAPIKNFLNNQAKGDSLLFIQGMSGPNVKIEFPYLTSLIKNGNIAINKAELELTVVKDSKPDIYPAIDQLVLRTAQFSPILDLSFDSNYGDGSTTRPLEKMGTSGGAIRTETVNGETVQKYYFNLSGHLNQILTGRRGSTIYISHLFKEEKSARVLLYGPKSSKYRAKLNLYYTKI